MSKVAITGNASGTGVFTIASPNSNSDRTLNLPDEAGTVLTSASTVAASQITGALNATGSAPIYACRAWVNFNGTGTVAIRASGNVSSVASRGTGLYTVNLTTAMSDTNYALSSHVHEDTSSDQGRNRSINGYPVSTSQFYINTTTTSTNTLSNNGFVCAQVFR
jgi:hypothetical protein